MPAAPAAPIAPLAAVQLPPDFNVIQGALNTLADQVVRLPHAAPLTRADLVMTQAIAAAETRLRNEITQAEQRIQTQITLQAELARIRIHNYHCPLDALLQFPPGTAIHNIPTTKNELAAAQHKPRDRQRRNQPRVDLERSYPPRQEGANQPIPWDDVTVDSAMDTNSPQW
ncbi:hypothetical protein BDN72DRAFT_865713 [Pluteus cervinus]|uniref:Uncharacterized protein n=1 Tax=Pluteus cervinus TaxID=181527 RepID=A0ACD2ZZC7_9AGAR|nr:hypothetical protein BDN72DRAFT_865713 [Pluteus cervinus]